MKSKIDKSLKEVWEMKKKLMENYEKSGSNDFAAYIKEKTKKTIEEYHLQYYYDNKVELFDNSALSELKF